MPTTVVLCGSPLGYLTYSRSGVGVQEDQSIRHSGLEVPGWSDVFKPFLIFSTHSNISYVEIITMHSLMRHIYILRRVCCSRAL